MSSSPATKLWLGVSGLVAGLVIGLGIVWVRSWYAPGGEISLQSAKQAYAVGSKALDDEQYQLAQQKLEEADLLASKAMEELDQRGETASRAGKGEEVRKVTQLQGEALWIKAQALRDLFYSSKGLAGEPVALTLDTSSGERFRTAIRISDPKVRAEAIQCQRMAALRLPKDPDILLDTLRVEVSLPEPNWTLVESLARSTLEIAPDDTRSLYLAARIEVEQPRSENQGPAVPVPVEKRNRGRLLKAREYLDTPAAQKIPAFRRLHLEAQIARDLRDHHLKTRKTKEAQKEDETLHKLILDPQSSLVQAMKANPQYKGLSRWDFDGLFGMHEMALERVLEDLTGTSPDPAPALAILERLVEAGLTQKSETGNRLALQQGALAAVKMAARIQPYLESRIDPQWQKDLNAVQALASAALESQVGTPELFSSLSQLLSREALIEGKRGNLERQNELKADAKKWLDEGLKTSKAESTGKGRFELLALAAERAALDGKQEEARKHLQEMRKATDPVAVATVALLDGLILEREGKLDRSRLEIEKVLSAPVPDLQLRAHLLLSQLYRTLNMPEKALASLIYLDRVLRGLQTHSEVERVWAQQFFATPEAISAQLVIAHLGTARAKVVRHLQTNGGKPAGVVEIIQPHEQAVAGLLEQLPKDTDLDRVARLDYAAFLASTGRVDQARKDLAALRTQYPTSVDLLNLEVRLLLLPAPGTKPPSKLEPEKRDEIDRRINQFLAANPTSQAGRLFRAQWLMRTERAEQAVAELQDSKNFPKPNPAQQQMLALALIAAGKKKEAVAALQHLPESARLDALLIQLAESREEKNTRLEAALNRHERNGLFLCWDGERQLNEGNPKEALPRFRQALEVTAVRPLAERGLRRALTELAQKDPKSAQDLARNLADELPREPLPALLLAYTDLVLGDLGTPADVMPKATTMGAALNEWETRMNAVGGDKLAIALTRAEFYAQANNVDQSRQEIERALILAPTNPEALQRGINLALAQSTPASLDRAQEYLAALRTAQPDALPTLLATGRLAEAREQVEPALAAYSKVLEQSPTDTLANQRYLALMDRKKDYDGMAARIETWTKADPEALAPKLYRVYHQAKVGKKQEAVETGRKLVTVESEKAEKKTAGTGKQTREQLRLDVGRQLLASGALVEGETWVNEILAENPDLLVAQLLKGDILLRKKSFTEACDLYRKILATHPENLIAVNNLAYTLGIDLDKPAEADQVIRGVRVNRFTGQIIPGDRLDPAFLDTIGMVFQKLNQPERLPEMREIFAKAAARYTEDPRIAWHLGHALAGLKEEAEARKVLDRAMKLLTEGSVRLSPEEQKVVRQGIEKIRTTLP